MARERRDTRAGGCSVRDRTREQVLNGGGARELRQLLRERVALGSADGSAARQARREESGQRIAPFRVSFGDPPRRLLDHRVG